jgi:uncharacterized protein
MTRRPHVVAVCRVHLARRGVALLSLTLLLALPGIAAAQGGAPATRTQPIRVLYVTGGGFHDFVAQEAIVPPGIAARTSIAWTIDHSAGKSTEALIDRHKDTEWAKAFDVVVYNMSFSHVVDVDWIERLAHAHRDSGVHAVILHGATHSYRRSETRAWGELMGAFSMRHDRQRPLTIEVLAPQHPVMRGFPATWTTIDEELYEIERVWPTMTPLAQAYSVESEKRYPVIWTNTYGKARVFVTTLGHNNEMMANPTYLDLVTRGLLWTMGLL